MNYGSHRVDWSGQLPLLLHEICTVVLIDLRTGSPRTFIQQRASGKYRRGGFFAYIKQNGPPVVSGISFTPFKMCVYKVHSADKWQHAPVYC